MTESEQEEWSKYIYLRLLNLDYYENLSTSAYEYLEKYGNKAKNDYLEDLALLDTNVCWEYFIRQPINITIEFLKEQWSKENDEYDTIASTLINVLFNRMYGDKYNSNSYHPVRFLCEFGIIPQLDVFEKITGEEVGGWMHAWDNPQIVMEAYKRHLKGIIHPSRIETKKTLEENINSEQMTIFDIGKEV